MKKICFTVLLSTITSMTIGGSSDINNIRSISSLDGVKNKLVLLPFEPSGKIDPIIEYNGYKLFPTINGTYGEFRGKYVIGDSIEYLDDKEYHERFEYKTSTYKSGTINNYYNYGLISLREITGVYSIYSSFISKPLLESGGYNSSYKEKHMNLNFIDEAVLFSMKVSNTFETKITEAFSISTTGIGSIEFSNTITESQSFTKEHSAFYSTKKYVKTTSSISFEMSEKVSNYCPDDFSMTIGTIAKYYIIELAYRNVVKTIFGDKKDKYAKTTIVLVDESSLIDTFVYVKTSDPNGTKYYLQ